jgi:hypothetical protein
MTYMIKYIFLQTCPQLKKILKLQFDDDSLGEKKFKHMIYK